MALADPIPVRFSAPTDDGLEAISEKTGIKKAELVRIAVAQFLDRVAETGEIVQRIKVPAFIKPHDGFDPPEARVAEEPPKHGDQAADPPRKPVKYKKPKPPKE